MKTVRRKFFLEILALIPAMFMPKLFSKTPWEKTKPVAWDRGFLDDEQRAALLKVWWEDSTVLQRRLAVKKKFGILALRECHETPKLVASGIERGSTEYVRVLAPPVANRIALRTTGTWRLELLEALADLERIKPRKVERKVEDEYRDHANWTAKNPMPILMITLENNQMIRWS